METTSKTPDNMLNVSLAKKFAWCVTREVAVKRWRMSLENTELMHGALQAV
jgi:hypothetical protein